MKTLAMYVPSITDATSFYRAVGPIGTLKSKLKDFSIMPGNDVNWATMKWADAVFMQRPFTQNHRLIIDIARANEKPLWVDYDDDLYNVPYSNRTHKFYSKKEIQNNVTHALLLAHRVTVSTEQLKQNVIDLIKTFKKNDDDQDIPEHAILDTGKVSVIPNAYDNTLFRFDAINPKDPANQLICWRGSDTHDKDMAEYTPAMREALIRNQEWTFNFIGNPFWYTIEILDDAKKRENIVVTESIDPIEYFKLLTLIRPTAMQVPLNDSSFNRAKSNIAWIEAVHGGGICLAPNWPEWQRPGIINYTGPQDYQEKLIAIMQGEYERAKMVFEAREYIRDCLALTKVNEARIALIEDLMGGSLQ